MDFQMGISLAHQTVTPLPDPMLEPLIIAVLTPSSVGSLRPLIVASFQRLNIRKSHNDRFRADDGWSNTFQHMQSSMSWTLRAALQNGFF